MLTKITGAIFFDDVNEILEVSSKFTQFLIVRLVSCLQVLGQCQKLGKSLLHEHRPSFNVFLFLLDSENVIFIQNNQ